MIALTRRAIPAEDEAFRADVRGFLDHHMPALPAARRARSWMGFDAAFSRAMAAAGFVGLTLPRRFGGAGRSAFARYVLVEEMLAAGAPVAAHWIADRQSGPLLLRYGTPEQQAFYLPRICRAEAFLCIGMSEPNSGSDLASVTSRATRAADGYRLNGRKIWTTNAPHAHYMIALVRTSGAPADRQNGLSQFIVDLSLPGITIRPIHDLAGDAHFSEVFFDDVQLAADALIGNEGSGWEQVNAELAFERSGPERFLSSIVLLEQWVAYLHRCPQPQSEGLLGRILARIAVLRAMSISVTQQLAEGASPVVEAALVKDLGTELEQFMPMAIGAALAAAPDTNPPPELAATLAYLTRMSPSFSLRGGTREILRGMIARGVGLR